MQSLTLHLALGLALISSAAPASEPIKLLPANPRYFEFRGEPAFLITSAEHYGAVLNRDFDFRPYLDELARRKFNLTRTFSGTYREISGSFNINDNTLAPREGRFLAPWVQVQEPGEPEKFDLDRFDNDYFARLKEFVAEAGKRGVVVEYVLFCPLYGDELWAANPMNARNNVNGVGKCSREEVFALKHDDLTRRQLAFVAKAVAELNAFDNLYFEICNEPYFGGVTLDWQKKVAEAIVATEKTLPNKHMISQNIANEKAKVENPDPNISLFNFHYTSPPVVVAMNAHLNKAIGENETGFKGTGDRHYRMEAWEFLLAGGALFNNLDYSFTPAHPDGTAEVKDPTPGGGGPEYRGQLATLGEFLRGCEFWNMKPAPDLLKGSKLAAKARASVLARPGEYALYVNDGPRATLTPALPPGSYQFEWIDPRSGKSLAKGRLSAGGDKPKPSLESPEFAEDIALKIVGVHQGAKADRIPDASLLARAALPIGAVAVTPPPSARAPRQIKVSEDKHFLVDQDGKPFFYLADTAWELFHRLDRDEADMYLKDRASKGFTAIQAVILAELDGLAVPNRMGHLPLKDRDPSQPNEDYFRDVDSVVDRANDLGLAMAILPTWGRWWHDKDAVFTPENAKIYGKFLGSRYRDKAVIWVLGGDRNVDNDRQKQIINAMAEGLREGDGGRHLITFHPTGWRASSEWFHEAPWLDFNMVQTGHNYNNPNYEFIAKDYRREPTKPCLDGEPGYEDHPANFKAQNGYMNEADSRKFAYWAVLAGACGHTYGCHDIWQFWEPGRPVVSAVRTPWKDALGLPGSGQMKHVRTLVESRPYLTRIPDQSLIVGDPGKGGDHVQAARDSDGSYAFVYIPSGKPVTIDAGKLKGKEIVASWFDPRDGSVRESGRMPSGTLEFRPPSQGAGNDWVLILDAR